MQDMIEFANPGANKIIAFILSALNGDNNIDISIDDEGAFYKMFFRETFNMKCPFSLWISFGNGDNVFINIGNGGQEATVFHHWDITLNEGVEEVIEFFDSFLFSEIQESKMFCKEKLKLIIYELKGKRSYPAYSFISATYLICFNKRTEIKLYERWL